MKCKFLILILLVISSFVVSLQNGCARVVEPPPVPVITDINGGISGSGTVGSLFIINGSGFGDLSAQTSGYSVDFRDSSTEAIVATALIDYAAGDWKNIFIKGTVPNALSASLTYKVTVTTPGGTSNAVNFLVVASVSFSPSTIAWSATSSLPAPLQGFPTVIATIGDHSYIYALGGNTSDVTLDSQASNESAVYLNQMDAATGSLKNLSWEATTPLPAPRGFSSAVFASAFNSPVGGNGFIYLIGGLDGAGNGRSEVFFAPLNLDGTVGSWGTTKALPQPLSASGAIIFHGRIYVAGGNDAAGSPVASVYSAKIKADGSLEDWQTLPALPEARAYHHLVTVADFLYVIGGDNAAVDPITNLQSVSEQNSVYYNQIDLLDGSLVGAAWTANTNTLTKKREKHTAVAAGSYILVSGGLYNGAGTGGSEQSYSTINSDGSLGSFQGATGSRTISGTGGGYNFYNHSSSYFVDGSGNPHVLILGGCDVNTGSPHAEVWYQH